MITVTQKAVDRIQQILAENHEPDKFFRVSAYPGCGGYYHQVGLDKKRDGDTEVETHGLSILTDGDTLSILDGGRIDFPDESKVFKFNIPNSAPSCGCGVGCRG